MKNIPTFLSDQFFVLSSHLFVLDWRREDACAAAAAGGDLRLVPEPHDDGRLLPRVDGLGDLALELEATTRLNVALVVARDGSKGF